MCVFEAIAGELLGGEKRGIELQRTMEILRLSSVDFVKVREVGSRCGQATGSRRIEGGDVKVNPNRKTAQI